MKKLVVAAPVLALVLGGTTACATKKMVKTQVGEVNSKVETLSKSVEENQERTRANIPLGDFGQPEDLGPLAVYLASDASRYMTGAALVIDGGYTLW